MEVYQFSLDGDLIKIWQSPVIACDSFRFDSHQIPNVLNKKQASAFGYIWRYSKDIKYPVGSEELKWQLKKEIYICNNPYAIDQYSIYGKYIKTWKDSKTITLELGINSSSIYKVCCGKRKSAGGYKWSYTDKQKKRNKLVDNK